MLHGVSLKHIDNTAIQQAIAAKADPNRIANLKASVAFNCVTGFEYYEVPFTDLANLLTNDIGFNNFKFKEASAATYNVEKHPNATGRIRGVNNIDSGCSWVWFDIDVTTISDTEMHAILGNINHHIARTSDPNKPYKYRILVELDREIHITRDEWKPFMSALGKHLGLGKIDNLAQSAVIYGYLNRNVLSVVDATKVDPTIYLSLAQAEVARRAEEDSLLVMSPGAASKALASPYSTFNYAYEAQIGDRWKTSMAAIQKAKQLGASKEYIQELMYHINDFLDEPKSHELVRLSLFSAI